jgi:Tol biopolymer transport system component
LGCVAGALAAPAYASASFPGANGRIAFVSSQAGAVDPPRNLFTIDPDGSDPAQLTTDNGWGEPSWSADGQKLVAIQYDSLYVMDADGGGRTLVLTAPNADLSSPHFSPSGRRIVYAKAAASDHRPYSIRSVRTDGTDRRLVIAGPDYSGLRSPEYAPSGPRIVFEGAPGAEDYSSNVAKQGIWTIRPNGSDLSRVTDPARGWADHEPDYSPDGEEIVFLRCDREAHSYCYDRAWIVRTDGSHRHRVDEVNLQPVYSPAGDQLAFTTPDASSLPVCGDIDVIPVSGGEPSPVTHNCADFEAFGTHNIAYEPSWQPVAVPLR